MATSTKKPGTATGKRNRLYWAVPAVLVGLVLVVLIARLLVGLPAVASFLATYPGQSELPDNAPVGFPAWLAWQHFLNAFFLLLIIRTGWQVRTTTKPSGHWTRNNKGLIRTKNAPTKITLELWFHLTLDALWVLNGLVFAVLLFATGQWTRIVPTSWDIFPNALSAALQYASLDWPTEDGWINYNALQLLTYFATVFIAAPLAFITGLRMSSAWPKKAQGLNKAYPIEWARAVHFPVMVYFVAFIVVHVFLVLATGALRNLNHMYGVRDDDTWFGFWVFLASVVVMAAAWFLARPIFLRPIASLMGKVSR
ncbi:MULTISPECIES: cytochrome b/b6 domain-containing protein [unclassified Arthrobacter]|uniref:cytochrome b/b6 domain-containing protein n=1 Tax=unclassified Arthrobacter TaxID=235627 RepID=UPI001C863A6D|nr:cytochrome b/b6 domain-containing protein [Arthrobacter sp. MAHUQ-56]MBX7445380.1 cytochrome b/b6 domain-containing protein [Arthrobacter sp. MAHUQ-56]